MKESTLWDHLKPTLQASGKFQKISDRFSPGVSDILGCFVGIGIAIELKELDGVRVIKAKFRPGQLDWLDDWDKAGGPAWIISTLGQYVFVHHCRYGASLENGMPLDEVIGKASLYALRKSGFNWSDFVRSFLSLNKKLR